MNSLFNETDHTAILTRISALQPASVRQWGKMNPAQMLAHLAISLENATGERPMKQVFLGKLVTPFIRKSIFGEKRFSKNAPTDPSYVISDQRDFESERTRVTTQIDKFVKRGEEAAGKETHPFFGKLSGSEWGTLLYKHIDHHLRQFGA